MFFFFFLCNQLDCPGTNIHNKEKVLKAARGQVVVVRAFNPSMWKTETGGSPRVKGRLAYKVSSRIVKVVTQKNHLSLKKKK